MRKIVHVISLLQELGGVQQSFVSYYKYAQKYSKFKQYIFSNHIISKKYGHLGLPEDTININFSGSAGQSFGAFGAQGLTFILSGK